MEGRYSPLGHQDVKEEFDLEIEDLDSEESVRNNDRKTDIFVGLPSNCTNVVQPCKHLV